MTSLANPAEECITHINLYSNSQSVLGRALSNFAHTPFTHPEYGHFESVEGFWYWLGTGKQHDVLRKLYGIEAKLEGRKYPVVHLKNFQEEIEKALRLKLEQHPRIAKALKASTLPLTHYYYFGNKFDRPKIIEPKGSRWVPEWFMRYRDES